MFNLFRKARLTPDQEAQYLQLCESLAAILQGQGFKIKPYQDRSLSRIRNHPNPQKVLKIWKIYHDLLNDAQSDGDDLKDDKKLLWRFIHKLNYTPASDIFDKIEEGHVVEVYTPGDWQIFRNMEFFNFVSISLDELATFLWSRDTIRKAEITTKALGMAIKLKVGLLKQTTDLRDWKEHLVQELLGEKWLLSINLQFVSPLKSKGEEENAAVLINISRVISSTS